MRRSPLRTLALFGAASAAVHELRYVIGYGGGASHALAAHPHGYLSPALPGVITAALIALASLLMRAAGGRRVETTRRLGLLGLWLACATALALIYGTQETLEGAGALAGSGWIGLALAIPAGLLVALALRGADAAEALRPIAARPVAIAYGFVVSIRARAARRRIAGSALGARGPPLPFVV